MSDCQLVCVDPARAHEVWPKVSGLIYAAMKRGGEPSAFGKVETDTLAGRALIWIAWDGEQIKAVAVTDLALIEGRKLCTIVACGGSNRAGWINLILPIEEFAKAEGCHAMRIIGRRGWARVLPTYRTRQITLEKELS